MKAFSSCVALFGLVASLPSPSINQAILNAIPGQYTPWSDARGLDPPFPGDVQGAILPTEEGPAAPDDILWQTLVTAEWIVFDFYVIGLQMFGPADFDKLGLNGTLVYDRLMEIRDNEAGHVTMLMQHISPRSIKPGQCKYDFNLTSPVAFLLQQIYFEAATPLFMPGLTQLVTVPKSTSQIAAHAEAENRHNVASLVDIWGTNPFGGPVETYYPYPYQILAQSGVFIVPGSCPQENPPFPNPPPRAGAPATFNKTLSGGKVPGPGDVMQFTYPSPTMQPQFRRGAQYFAVFFHALSNISVPLELPESTARIPGVFEKAKGAIIAVVADSAGAPTEGSVVAGPVILIQQPDLTAFGPP